MIYSILGLIGAALACGAYLGLHRHRLSLRAYAWANLASAAFCGLSLIGQFNLGGLLIETFFAAVSADAILHRKELQL